MATYYVSGATGDDGNDGLSEGAAKATIQGTVNQIATTASDAENTIYVKADATYSEQVSLSNATYHTKIAIIGYDSTPGDDAAQAEINATSQTNGIAWTGGNTVLVGFHFRNLEIHSATGSGILTNNSTTASTTNRLAIVNCYIHDCGSSGVDANGRSMRVAMLNTRVVDNTVDGVLLTGTTNQSRFSAVGCEFSGNVNGVVCSGSLTCISCLAVGNSQWSFRCNVGSTGGNPPMTVVNCTVDGLGAAGTTGVSLTGGGEAFPLLVNNVIVGCEVDYALAANVNLIPPWAVVGYNTSHDINTPNSGVASTPQHLTNDPLFIDPNNDDYRLQLPSPSKGSGYDLNNLLGIGSIADRGAQQVLPVGGGGGTGGIRTGGQL